MEVSQSAMSETITKPSNPPRIIRDIVLVTIFKEHTINHSSTEYSEIIRTLKINVTLTSNGRSPEFDKTLLMTFIIYLLLSPPK